MFHADLYLSGWGTVETVVPDPDIFMPDTAIGFPCGLYADGAVKGVETRRIDKGVVFDYKVIHTAGFTPVFNQVIDQNGMTFFDDIVSDQTFAVIGDPQMGTAEDMIIFKNKIRRVGRIFHQISRGYAFKFMDQFHQIGIS